MGCTVLLYLNYQFLQPYCLNHISNFEEKIFKAKTHGTGKQVNALLLKDNTLLIYQLYDAEQKAFFDAYWLKNSDCIYRIQSLSPYEDIPVGKYVDTLTRTQSGELVKTASFETSFFPQMHFDRQALFSAVHPPQMQSVTQLARSMDWKQVSWKKMNDREAEAATCFYFKLTMPLMCLLVVMGPAPFCLRFSRTLPVFLIYALSLFGIIAFYTLINSFVILGENQVIAPLLAILLPQSAFFLLLGWRYAKL